MFDKISETLDNLRRYAGFALLKMDCEGKFSDIFPALKFSFGEDIIFYVSNILTFDLERSRRFIFGMFLKAQIGCGNA